MIRVILAEKPDQAREYAKALGEAETKNGVIIIKKSEYLEGEIHIVAARGHLFEYDYPKISWDLTNLPIIDIDLNLILKSGDADIKKRFSTIKNAVKKADEVIIGTDADREGERIAYTILSQIPGGLNKVKKRLWINSMTTEGIRKSFTELRDSNETKNFYYEAEARSQSDWFVGFNLSPLVTLDLQRQKRLERKKENAMSVGRVQTPAVRLICDNDSDIKNFVSQPFWKIELVDSDNNIIFKNDKKYLDRDQAFIDFEQLSDRGVIQEIEKKQVEKYSPKLFELTSLQAYGAKNWKKDSDEILKIAQALYEKKVLTYPRTDLPYITHYEFDYLKSNLSNYQNLIGLPFRPENMEPRKRYVNDKKVKEHFAIIPTDVLPDMNTLSADEKLIYETVTRRTILMFAGNYKYQSTLVKIENNGVSFSATGNSLVALGYKEFLQSKETEDTILPNYQELQSIPLKTNLKEDKTKPPSRITESTLMGKIFVKYGLGTPATRANIITTIQKRGYIRKDKKSGELFPTARGYLLINYLSDNPFANPETTAGWEHFLKQIGEGELSQEAFVEGIKKSIKEQVLEVKNKI